MVVVCSDGDEIIINRPSSLLSSYVRWVLQKHFFVISSRNWWFRQFYSWCFIVGRKRRIMYVNFVYDTVTAASKFLLLGWLYDADDGSEMIILGGTILGEQNNIPDELQQKNFCWYGVRLVFDDTTCYVMKRQDIYNMIQDNFFYVGARCYITKNYEHLSPSIESGFYIHDIDYFPYSFQSRWQWW